MFSLQAKKLALVVVAAVLTALVFFNLDRVFPPVGCGIGAPCPPPSMSTIPFLIFLDFWDALAFGVGVALLIWGAISYSKWPQAIRTPLLILLFIALWFTLLNWIHDGWHRVNGMNMNGIVAIEFVFHVPWLIFGAVLAFTIVRISHAYQPK